MSLYKIQGVSEKLKGIYYEFNSDDIPLGEGGMGKVYRGRCVDEKTGKSREVAVKFMYSDLPSYAIEKARREAAIRFRHDNLIEMLGFIETEGKTVLGEPVHYYHVVSELLEGVSLDKMFEGKLTDQQGRPVPFAEKLYKDYQQDVNHFAVEIIKNILSGLLTMHDAGYIHRDIDPTNIMITSNGQIKLIDFGIAKKMNSLTTHDKHLTQAGQFVGKPEYAAPELVLGALNEQNQTTDLYAVGILLFQCIVGHVPFEGDRSDILQKQLHAPLPLKLIKHKGLRKVIETATNKMRSKRFQSAAEFRVALERLDLSSNGNGLIKTFIPYIIGGVAACGIMAGVFHFYNQSHLQETDGVSYPLAIKTLYDSGNSEKGIEQLKLLSDSGDADATYLLSRLYFKSKLPEDYCPDSITLLQNKIHILCNNQLAHQLLQKTVDQNPQKYQALYELACDYWKAEQRTEAVPERDGDKAEFYYSQALTYAQKAKDEMYMEMINGYLDKIKLWRENLLKINSN